MLSRLDTWSGKSHPSANTGTHLEVAGIPDSWSYVEQCRRPDPFDKFDVNKSLPRPKQQIQSHVREILKPLFA